MDLPGSRYVYLNYGMHYLVNVVTEAEGAPAAVLIRALEPLDGIATMRRRRSIADAAADRLCRGPGNVTKAMGFRWRTTRSTSSATVSMSRTGVLPSAASTGARASASASAPTADGGPMLLDVPRSQGVNGGGGGNGQTRRHGDTETNQVREARPAPLRGRDGGNTREETRTEHRTRVPLGCFTHRARRPSRPLAAPDVLACSWSLIYSGSIATV